MAAVSSGRSLFTSCWFTKWVLAGAAGAGTVSTLAEPPSPAALKAVGRTVMTFLASEDCTVSSALPA